MTTTSFMSGVEEVRVVIVLGLIVAALLHITGAFSGTEKYQPRWKHNMNAYQPTELPSDRSVTTTVFEHSSDIGTDERVEDKFFQEGRQPERPSDDPGYEDDSFKADLYDDTEDEFLSSYSWGILDDDEDEDPFIDEDQVDAPEMMYGAEQTTASLSEMEKDFFDYMENLETYGDYDAGEKHEDEENTSPASAYLEDGHLFRHSYVSPTLSSTPTLPDECDGDPRRTKKKKYKKKQKDPEFQIITMSKMGKGKLMSRWQKNCCIRGRRVGSTRRTFLSNNLFKECKQRTRSLRSRMSRSCKWIFWSCCEAKALRRYYFFTKTRNKDSCP